MIDFIQNLWLSCGADTGGNLSMQLIDFLLCVVGIPMFVIVLLRIVFLGRIGGKSKEQKEMENQGLRRCPNCGSIVADVAFECPYCHRKLRSDFWR